MKKALAIISALALVSAAAFAEDAAPALKISGYVDTGIRTITTNSTTDRDSAAVYGDDSGKASRFDLNGEYTNGNAGVVFKLRDQTGLANANAFNFDDVEAWTTLADGKVKIVGGKLDTAVWKTEADDNFTSENGTGIQIQLIPVTGLNIGVKYNVADGSVTTPYTTTQALGELGFGGKYASDLVNIEAGYKLDSKADGLTTVYGLTDATFASNVTAGNIGTDKGSSVYFGVNYKGTPKLTLKAEAIFYNLGAWSDVGQSEINEVVAYQVSDPFAVGLVAYQYTVGNSEFKSVFSFKPYVAYAFNSLVTANGEVKYTVNDTFTKDVNTFYVKPGVTLNVSPNSKIIIYDNYQIQDINKKGTVNDASGSEKTLTTNSIVVNFRFNF